MAGHIMAMMTAMIVPFLSDTTLSLAFRIKDGFSDIEALEWVNANVTLGGSPVVGKLSENATTGSRFVIVAKQNIAIEDSSEKLILTADGLNSSVSVRSYIVAAEERGSEELKALTRALLAYAQAATALSQN